LHLITHKDTPHSAGLPWMSNQPVRGFYLHNTQQGQEKHLCPWWDSNPQSQQTSGCRHALDCTATLGLGNYFIGEIVVSAYHIWSNVHQKLYTAS